MFLFNRNKNGLISYFKLDKFFLTLSEENKAFFKDEITKCFVFLDENAFNKKFRNERKLTNVDFVCKMAKRLSNKKEFSLATELLEFATDNTKKSDEKHAYLNELIEVLYKQRENDEYIEKCKLRCLEDMHLISNKKVDDKEPVSFKRLAIILESEGNVNEALKVSKDALSLGLHDGTKTGYEGRIQKLSN